MTNQGAVGGLSIRGGGSKHHQLAGCRIVIYVSKVYVSWLTDTSHPRSSCDCPPHGLGRLWRQLNSREPDFFFPPCYCAAGNAGLKFLLWDGDPIQQGFAHIRHGLLEPPHADFHKAHAPLPVGIHLMAQAFLVDGVALQASHQL